MAKEKRQTKQKKDDDSSVVIPDIDLSNPEFRTAMDLLTETDSSVFLTGKAGTGKSTFLRYITAVTQKSYVILAPTGIAAVNVGGQTIHSFFKIPLKPLLPDDPDFAVRVLRKRLKYSSSLIKLINRLELIIIDEISMVRADVIDFIDKILRVYSGNMRVPFGGKQMLFVGDVFQLEPVVTGNDRDVLSHYYPSSYYFFNARVFDEINLVPIELTKVYRQDEGEFIRLLDNVRMGHPTPDDIRLLNSRYQHDIREDNATDKDDFVMTIATRRDMVDSINETHLAQLTTPEVTYTGKIIEDFPMNALPTDIELRLKVGAQVVFIKNDPERRWVNGTLAVVEVCTDDTLTVRTEDGEVHEVEPETWDNVKYVYNEQRKSVDEVVLGSFIQYPVKLAWALTIHKSQGLTFNRVIIDLGRGAFTGGQTYVALSRCRTLAGITLRSAVSPRDIYVHPVISSFAARFNNDNLIHDAIDQSRANALYRSAAESFDRGDISMAVERFAEAVTLRNELTNPAAIRLINQRLGIIRRQQAEIASLHTRLADDERRFRELADEYVRLGDECRREGWDIEAALRNYDRALSLSPHHFDAFMGRAGVYELSGNHEDAEASYFSAYIAADKSEAWRPLAAIGDLHSATGDYFGAVAKYLEAFDCAPGNVSVIERLVEAYEALGDTDTAAEYKKLLTKARSKRK